MYYKFYIEKKLITKYLKNNSYFEPIKSRQAEYSYKHQYNGQ